MSVADYTTIDLCLDVFWWAKFRKNKAAIKLHNVLDITTEIRRIYSAKVDKTTGVIFDQTVRLSNYYSAKEYPEKLR